VAACGSAAAGSWVEPAVPGSLRERSRGYRVSPALLGGLNEENRPATRSFMVGSKGIRCPTAVSDGKRPASSRVRSRHAEQLAVVTPVDVRAPERERHFVTRSAWQRREAWGPSRVPLDGDGTRCRSCGGRS
jgi:hypothetical protein